MQFRTQFALNFSEEIIVDYFAGGGGASTGLEMGLQRPVAVAKNHNPIALSMHEANHPHARHLVTDVFEGHPLDETLGRPVGWFHASPDCTHHSQARGGQPRERAIRNLPWVVLKWAGTVRPRIISLENVKQILQWGPLVAKRDKSTGRVLTLDKVRCHRTQKMVHRVADAGEVVPVSNQYLVPCPRRSGRTWRQFVAALRALGYDVDWKILKACDFGAPTTRQRLYMVARCDGEPIVWPEATHAKKPKRGSGLLPYRTAAECIDWSIRGRSIFDRPKPLAEATMRRIAKGMKRYVLDSADPFIVPIANWSNEAIQSVRDPLSAITAWPKGGSHTLVAPVLTKFRFDSAGARLDEPLPVITSGGNCVRPAGAAHAMGVATAFLAQMNGGFNTTHALDARQPVSTIQTTGSQQQLVAANLLHLRGNCDARDLDDSLQTISAGGEHHGLVEYTLSQESQAGALKVAAFLIQYYSEGGQWGGLDKPLDTITTRDRLALVTVYLQGEPYVIVDIELRMLTPRELYRAQGFPDKYIIEFGHDLRKFTKAQQVFMCGNSVSPPPLAAIARANDPWRSAAIAPVLKVAA